MNENMENNENLESLENIYSAGMKGICYDIRKGKFKVYVDMFGVRTHLGYFSTLGDATPVRDNFINTIRESHYPLSTFICEHFNVSFNKSLSLIASALKAFINRDDCSPDIGRMFPPFAISFTQDVFRGCGDADNLVSVGSARSLLSIQDPATDIIFGRTSISKFRSQNHIDYHSVINTLTQIANGL